MGGFRSTETMPNGRSKPISDKSTEKERKRIATTSVHLTIGFPARPEERLHRHNMPNQNLGKIRKYVHYMQEMSLT